MNNLGKANVKIEVAEKLIYINPDPARYNFDVSAHQWQTISNSPALSPFSVENILSDEFAAIYPAKRKNYIDNFMTYKDGKNNVKTDTELPYILWTATDSLSGILKDIFSSSETDQNKNPYDSYTLQQPQQFLPYSSDYTGPQWDDAVRPRQAPSNDIREFYQWLTNLGVKEAKNWKDDSASDRIDMRWINQHVVRDGLWWGIESNSFIKENMPLWMNLKIARSPASSNHETMFIISLGLDDEDNAFDIVIGVNRKPYIIDYCNGRKKYDEAVDASKAASEGDTVSADKALYVRFDFEADLSSVWDTQEDIAIGVMTIAGRVIVWINDVYMIYSRIEKTETEDKDKEKSGSSDDKNKSDNTSVYKEAKIAAGRMRIYGTNVQSIINVSPMTFAPVGVVAMPTPSLKFSTSEEEKKNNKEAVYKGVKYDGTLDGSVAVLPQPPDVKEKLYGVDCKYFIDKNGTVEPEGVALHKNGTIYFNEAGDAGITSLPDSNFYIMVFRTDDLSIEVPTSSNVAGETKSIIIKNAGCPYFFRIKGGYERVPNLEEPDYTIITDVISASESLSSPDYFHSKATASVEIYNKDGDYDYLKGKQYGIRIYWGWGDNISKTFTGIITSVSSSEVPGKEILTLQCEDYMYVLNNIPIVNSPFYDGMVAYYAIQDLAKRAGLTEFVNGIKSKDGKAATDDYFLPSGYTFTKPAMRFPQKNTIFQCIMDIVKRFEAFVYFDGDGKLHINKLPGGLFSEIKDGSKMAEYSRDPTTKDDSRIILNEKNIEINYSSTVNRINIFTLDRDTRNAVLYTHSATEEQNLLPLRRLLLYDQPALGDLEVARTYAERLGKRVFYSIRKTTFATIGKTPSSEPKATSKIFDFIKVDDLEFRIMSIAKKYSADSNDFTNEYGCEWLGGNTKSKSK